MTNKGYSVSDILRKQILDAINALRNAKKKYPDGNVICSYIIQQNATNLDESSVLIAIKFLLEENLLKNTLKKGRDPC